MGGLPPAARGRLSRHQCSNVLSARCTQQRAGLVEIDHAQRQTVVAAQHDRGGVHHGQALVEHLVVGQSVVAARGGILHGIGVVDPVHLGRLHEQVGLDLDGAQARRRVRREERVTRSCCKDNDPSFLEMAHRAAADVVLAHLVDPDRGLHAHEHANRLQGVLQRERVHHRRQHAHVVGSDTVHAGPREAGAAEDIAAADHDGHLRADLPHGTDLGSEALQECRIDPVVSLPHQGLAGQLDEDASVGRFAVFFCSHRDGSPRDRGPL
jgi:hypothetical protein